jgi:OOP family OmpA-OmpF porin
VARGVSEAQVASDGVGYLSPVASNLTAAGREANRRVEAVLISTE